MSEFNLSARPFIDAFTQGEPSRKLMAMFVKAFAALAGLGGAILWFAAWELIWPLGPWAAMAFTFSQIVMVAAVVKVVQIIYLRGEAIARVPDDALATVSILSLLCRLPGEVAMIFFAVFSLPAMLLTWSGAASVVSAFGVPAASGPAFASGLLAFVTCWVMGVGALAASYVVAESLAALRSMALDLRAMRSADAAPCSMPQRAAPNTMPAPTVANAA